MNLYPFGKALCSIYFKSMYKVEVIGEENFPKEGGVLLCSNHISNFDPPVVGVACPRTVHFMAKAELFEKPVGKAILNSIQAFPVKRGLGDKQALRNGLNVLKQGQVLGLFPEGTRSKTGEIGKGLAGAGFFALKSNAKVVPCAIIGSYEKFKKLKIVFGPPIEMDEYRERKASAGETTEMIMDEIRKLKENNSVDL